MKFNTDAFILGAFAAGAPLQRGRASRGGGAAPTGASQSRRGRRSNGGEPVAAGASLQRGRASRGGGVAPTGEVNGFADLQAARTWAAGFVHWYNVEHRHSGIQYVSPAQRHAGEDEAILAARHTLYTQARELNPARWSGKTRDWTPIRAVTLNPERDCVIKAYSGNNDIQQLAA